MRPLKAYIMPRRLSSARTGSSAAKLRASFFVADTWTVSVQPIDCFRHAKLLAWRRVERTPGYFPVANPRARTHFTTVNCAPSQPPSACFQRFQHGKHRNSKPDRTLNGSRQSRQVNYFPVDNTVSDRVIHHGKGTFATKAAEMLFRTFWPITVRNAAESVRNSPKQSETVRKTLTVRSPKYIPKGIFRTPSDYSDGRARPGK